MPETVAIDRIVRGAGAHAPKRVHRRWARRSVVVVAIAIWLTTASVPAAAFSGGLSARDACAAGSDDHVALVIDFGTVSSVPDAPRGMIIECVAVAPGATGLDVLRSHAATTGLGMRFHPSGLLCALDAYPAADEGCGTRVGDHFRYWSYWRGDASGWTYQNIGPAEHRVKSGRVEGWRFVDAGLPGEGSGLVPPRNIAGRPSQKAASNVASNICAPAAPATTRPSPQPSQRIAPSPQAPQRPTQTPRPPAEPGDSHSATTTTVAEETNEASTTTVVATEPTSTVAAVTGTAADSAPVLSTQQVQDAASGKDADTSVMSLIGVVVALGAISVLGALGVRRSRSANGS